MISTQDRINAIRKSLSNRVTEHHGGYGQVTDNIALSLFFLLSVLPGHLLYPAAFFHLKSLHYLEFLRVTALKELSGKCQASPSSAPIWHSCQHHRSFYRVPAGQRTLSWTQIFSRRRLHRAFGSCNTCLDASLACFLVMPGPSGCELTPFTSCHDKDSLT